MVAVAKPEPMIAAVVEVRCWSSACMPNGQRRLLLRAAIEGKATLFLPCPRCGSYNIREIEDGIVLN